MNLPPLTEGRVAKMENVMDARHTDNKIHAGMIYSLFVASFPNKTEMMIEMIIEFTEIMMCDLLSDIELSRK